MFPDVDSLAKTGRAPSVSPACFQRSSSPTDRSQPGQTSFSSRSTIKMTGSAPCAAIRWRRPPISISSRRAVHLSQRPLQLAALQSEALAVLKAANIQPAKVSAAAPHVIPKVLRLPNWLFTRLAKGMLKTDPAAKTSMCEDLQNGRTTEIDDLCGAVLRLAAQHAVKAPLNQAVLDLVISYKTGQNWSGTKMRAILRV